MPRPEQVVPVAPEGAPHGTTADLQRLAQAVPSPSGGAVPPPTGFQPLAPAPGEDPTESALPEPLALEAGEDLTGMDDLLFGPTDRPDEPLTAGVPFGPGAVSVRGAHESDRQFLMRIAETLSSQPGAPAAVRRFAERVRRGE